MPTAPVPHEHIRRINRCHTTQFVRVHAGEVERRNRDHRGHELELGAAGDQRQLSKAPSASIRANHAGKAVPMQMRYSGHIIRTDTSTRR
jgi:hypothetical protein